LSLKTKDLPAVLEVRAMAESLWVLAISEWHWAQTAGPVYSLRAGAAFLGHHPGCWSRFWVLIRFF
jgi:hypothetical protein